MSSAFKALEQQAIDGILRPVVLASFLSCAVCGLILGLAVTYASRFQNDRRVFKVLVAFLTLAALADTAFNASWAYFNEFAYIWRVWIVSGSSGYLVAGLQLLLALAGAGCAFYVGVWARDKTSLLQFTDIQDVAYIWLGLGVVTDCLITASMFYFLVLRPKQVSGVEGAYSSPLTRIVVKSFETNFVSLLLQSLALGLLRYSLKTNTMWYALPGLLESKTYIACVLATLNSRRSVTEGDSSLDPNLSNQRTKGYGARLFTSGSRANPQSVRVTVTRDVDVDHGSQCPQRDSEAGGQGGPYEVKFVVGEEELDELEKAKDIY
ncbi:hypothetical protein JCM10213_003243 [Rhodosporidiobolus nylandii]